MRDRKAPALSQEVAPESWFYWQAYHHLRGDGMDAMGFKPIPLGAIVNYARDWADITCKIEQARLVRVVMAMDVTERDYRAKKAAK